MPIHPALAVANALLEKERSIYLGRESAQAPASFGSIKDHALVLGPPRCGKTTGIIIPSVGVHPGPAVVVSTRDDVIAATQSARSAIAAERGGSVQSVVFGGASTKLVPRTNWSIISGCKKWNTARDRANTLAATAVPNPEDRFWKNAGADLLAACLFAAAITKESESDLVRRIELQDLHRYHSVTFKKFGTAHPAPKIFSRFAEGSGGMAPETRASVFVTITSQILGQFGYLSPKTYAAFDIESFVRSWGTIYLTVPLERAANLGPLVSAFVSAICTAWTAAASEYVGVGRGTLLLALDEVANVAPLPTLPSLITTGAGDGIQCLMGMQFPGQASRWGGEASVVTGGAAHTAIFRGLVDDAYLQGISRLQAFDTHYDRRVEVLPNIPRDIRLADDNRLISERLQLEEATSSTPTRLRRIAAKKAAAHLLVARLRDGVQIRQSGSDGVQGLLDELMATTRVRQEPTRRSVHEAQSIARGLDDHCFMVSRSQGRFAWVVPWDHDQTWNHVLKAVS